MMEKRKKWPYLVVLVGFNPEFCLTKVTKNGAELRLKPTKTTKHGHFLRFSIKKHPKVSDLTQKNFFEIFGPLCLPPRGTHISASRTLIKNRLDESSNLPWRSIHAKFQPNSTIRLARARGVVRFFT